MSAALHIATGLRLPPAAVAVIGLTARAEMNRVGGGEPDPVETAVGPSSGTVLP